MAGSGGVSDIVKFDDRKLAVTTKHAGDFVCLTAAFLRQGSPFQLHPVLEQTSVFSDRAKHDR